MVESVAQKRTVESQEQGKAETHQADVCLVNMPFAEVHMPSMALSILKACLTERGISSIVQYEHLYFAQKFGGLEGYLNILGARIDFLGGEVAFSRAAHGSPIRSLAEYVEYIRYERLGGCEDCIPPWLLRRINHWLDGFPKRQEIAEEFIGEAAERILRCQPKIVALASMFQQINSNIALARRLKDLAPNIVIMMGGSNCSGEAGLALLDHIEAVDYVFFGEADEIFADVCESVLRDGRIPPEEFPYGVLSHDSARPQTVIHRLTRDVNRLPIPDFSDYFATYERLGFPLGRACFMVEGSRGCWWGRQKPCTFCGLNGPARNYRDKTTDRLADEIAVLANQWPRVGHCIFTDSILSRAHVKELPEALKKRTLTALDFFVEVKANLTPEEAFRLSEVGFARLQPGIESLQDDLLQLMNKGCRAIRQIETLKSFRTYRIWPVWNLLCGFPGEKEEYLADMAELLPKLSHLNPPNMLLPIAYHRYGEYTEHPGDYGLSLRPAQVYDFAFADEDFIHRTAYFFESTDEETCKARFDCRRMGKAYETVMELVGKWNHKKNNPDRLDMEIGAEGIDIYDMREFAEKSVHHLHGLAARLYASCTTVRTEESLLEEFKEYEPAEVLGILARLERDKLAVHIGREYLALAIDRAEARKVPGIHQRRW